jgi:mannose-6-phosphate isomerase-like protein (cupin superfamily)
MKGYVINIEEATENNNNFRKVLYTSKYSQLVLINLKPKEEIGVKIHSDNDQFFHIEEGRGKCIIDGNEYELEDDVIVIVPAGAEYNVINISENEDLKLYAIYFSPHYKDGTLRTLKKKVRIKRNNKNKIKNQRIAKKYLT